MPSYTIVDVPERWVVGTRDVIPADSMVTFFDRVYNDTAARITDVGGSVLGPAVAYYFTPVVDTVDMLGGFPVVADVAAKTSGAVQFSAVKAAKWVHRGSYDTLAKAWKYFVEDLVKDGYSRDTIGGRDHGIVLPGERNAVNVKINNNPPRCQTMWYVGVMCGVNGPIRRPDPARSDRQSFPLPRRYRR